MRAINDGQKILSAIKEEMIKVRCSFSQEPTCLLGEF